VVAVAAVVVGAWVVVVVSDVLEHAAATIATATNKTICHVRRMYFLS